jgi:glycosyltransferase involved in cell wall biosynthesis
VSGEKEQFPGLREKLKNNNVNHVTITGLDDHKDFLGLVKEFEKYVRQFQPNLIHCHTNWQLAISVVCKAFLKRDYSIIYTVHGYRHNYRYRSRLARYIIGLGLLAFADKVITPSTFLKNKFSFLDKRVHVLFMGLDKDFFNNHEPASFNGTKRLIFPGEFRHGKNQDLLIHVMKRYIDRTGDTNIELYLPGDGITLENCRRKAHRLGLGEKVFFPGLIARDEMIDLYSRCQFAVIPSNVETFGFCIAEPYALGRVVISRHTGVADDIIIHGENGFLYDSEKELVELLVKILPDEERCTRVARKAFEGRDLFRWSSLTEKYLALIEG